MVLVNHPTQTDLFHRCLLLLPVPLALPLLLVAALPALGLDVLDTVSRALANLIREAAR